ncbi:MAG: tRNA (adenosine(37)-N6)-threonylcarbamoyltransferase complex transferase subunit TsaD [Clostridiales bacterium]|nr:tRNA (adenosine(37)-N6)-threonylcarbamoyltransferase complex transferase subunit TsaD [Clostridiales bacterium]
MKDLLVLGIESSCDETSAAVVLNGREILSNVISSQIKIHKKYGGVVPEIASRKHIESIVPVVSDALAKANKTLDDIDVIGVTKGPGLVGALLVGVSFAKAVAFSKKKPLVGVNHIQGHICANFLQHPDLEPPFICLVVSGGHSHIVYVKDYVTFEILGQTRDDAAGEAFDKIARAVGLGYPGGPLVDNMAKKGDAHSIEFPRVYFKDRSFDFSFSGLKTAVLNYINIANQKNESINIYDVCASFQQAVVDVLVENTLRCAKNKKLSTVVLAGGVAANNQLRQKMQDECCKNGYKCYYPLTVLCTDNAAMIASAAYYEYSNNNLSDITLNAYPSLKLGKNSVNEF